MSDHLDLLATLEAWQNPPPPHAEGTHPLWTEPHLAASMLQAHLDPGTDAASRRPETIDATVAWLTTVLPPGGRVLDLGCGPGLYTSRLARAGFDVTGVDWSAGSLAHAREHSPEVRYLRGDYRELALAEHFDAVLLIYLDLGVLSPADLRRVLERVRGWLGSSGVFVCDVATAAHRAGSEGRQEWGVQTGGFWSAERHLWLTRTLRYDAEGEAGPTYLDEHIVVTADETRVYRVWERSFTPESLRAEFAAAGLRVQAVHGDLTGSEYREGSSTMIGAIATRA